MKGRIIPSVLLALVTLLFYATACDNSDQVWMVYEETQCADAWDTIDLDSTTGQVREYLDRKGVRVIDLRIVTYSIGPFCSACTCPSGKNIRVLVRNSNKEVMVGLGFTE